MITIRTNTNTLVLSICCLLTSCSSKSRYVPTPDGVGLFIIESRISGAGPAPDSIRVYLTSTRKLPHKGDVPIFEGQDVGSVCYRWVGAGLLRLSISGGYLDRIYAQWHGVNGRTVIITYDGTNNCHWKASKIQ